MSNLKKAVLDIVEIAKECPENLQQKCFELLLLDFLNSKLPSLPQKEAAKSADGADNHVKAETETKEKPAEIVKSGLHIKAVRFLDKYSLTIEQINNLYYKEGDDILPLFEDLKTTRLAESQIRIALLQCLKNSLVSGDFECEVEKVRTECNDRKCYDTNNFGGNFSNNADLFDFKTYSKSIKQLKLSEKGRSELASLIKELQ